MTTRAYNISELGLMRLDDLFYYIDHYSDNIRCMGEYMYSIKDGGAFDLPIKSYAASVVERFAEICVMNSFEYLREVKYSEGNKQIFVYVESKWSDIRYVFFCPINPFTGMLNQDGTQRTSATREEIEQWKKEG